MQYTFRTIAALFSSSSIRIRRLLLAGLLTGGFCSPAMAQEPPATPPAKAVAGEWYTVTGRNVNIRCAPNISGSYSMGKLQKGDRALVLNQNNGWASIQTTGPSFKQIFGLLRADNKVKENGNMVEVLTTTPLLAPNVPTNNDPIRSWKQLLSLKPGTTLKVQKSFDNALDGTINRWLLVQIPPTATVFVNMAFLAPENPSKTAPTPTTSTETATPAEIIAPVAAATTATTAATATTSEATTTSATTGDTALPTEPAKQQAEKATEKVKDPEPATTTTTDVAFDPADGSSTGVKVKNLDPFADVTIDQAEDAWKAMRSDGGADKEIETLQLIYTVIASDENASPESKRLAELRIRQLEMQRQVQDRLRRLETIEQRNTVDRSRMQNAQILIEARAAYDAVGRINASRVYDGKRLPQLFRLQAPGGGRTIGYIRPNDEIDVLPMLGRLVGIVGPKNYDAGYRLLMVTPKRIDILTASADGE